MLLKIFFLNNTFKTFIYFLIKLFELRVKILNNGMEKEVFEMRVIDHKGEFVSLHLWGELATKNNYQTG